MKFLIFVFSIIFLGTDANAIPDLPIVRKLTNNNVRSEGLDIYDGFLWQSVGEGDLLKRDIDTGVILSKTSLPSHYEESIKWINGVLWHLEYLSNSLFVGNIDSQNIYKYTSATLPVAAWGIEFDGTDLMLSVSEKIYFVDPVNLSIQRVLSTNIPARIEDLAWDGFTIWTTGYDDSRRIYQVDPKTGKVLATYKLPDKTCKVLDGVAIRDGELFVTGKGCSSIYISKIH